MSNNQNNGYTLKEGQATLFKNNQKNSDNQPDYTGRIMVNGKELRLAAWKRTSASGVKYLSLQASEFNGGSKADDDDEF